MYKVQLKNELKKKLKGVKSYVLSINKVMKKAINDYIATSENKNSLHLIEDDQELVSSINKETTCISLLLDAVSAIPYKLKDDFKNLRYLKREIVDCANESKLIKNKVSNIKTKHEDCYDYRSQVHNIACKVANSFNDFERVTHWHCMSEQNHNEHLDQMRSRVNTLIYQLETSAEKLKEFEKDLLKKYEY